MTESVTRAVGFIGLGAMGLGMAANLVKAGHAVYGYDPSEERRELADAAGITLVGSPREAAERASDVVFSVVRDAAQTQAVLLGEQGVVRAGGPRTVVVASTLDPTTMVRLEADLAKHGVTAVDTTMSGGPWGAEAGTLTLMVSGAGQVFNRLRPLLDVIGANIFHLGERVGTAQATKLAVQLTFGINMMGVFEAIRLVDDYQVDEDALMAALSVSVGGSWVVDNWRRVKPWWEHYRAGEDLDILLKDMRAVLREADAAGFPMPVTALSFQLMRHVWPAWAALKESEGADDRTCEGRDE
ncbi:NAD(P)-dependent oxidoreductase [Sinosporangium siamense]|uniref:3-hydroxyisobutyrate dehydrogenase n=1 Tax=Sinosporangium siamense TaxID=1367973 RepID=A0A919RFK2_9ACTN|nr:NAD(P)-dependent oxidoreductase [Sinosporangium siamense]GII92797.1 3-hydroxyisobutyrate dehydrogenase [Sinosporangium siamense]